MKKIGIIFLFIVSSIIAQEKNTGLGFELGADAVSRFVWRGSENGNSPQIQPYGSFELTSPIGNFSVGAWGSYGLSGEFNENDIFAKYAYETKIGEFSISVTDMMFPYTGIEISNFKGNGEGAHTVEFVLSYNGNESFPVNFSAGQIIHNHIENEKTLYLETGFTQTLGEVTLNYFIGAVNGQSFWYGIENEGIKIINLGISAEKEIKISENFSLPMGFSLITNPYKKTSFIIFKLSL